MKYKTGNYFFLPLLAVLVINVHPSVAYGQQVQQGGWQMQDLKRDKVMGISSDLAYQELLQGRTGVPVVVAVIDGGIDTSHLELSPVLWRNSAEIPGNGKDDDNNGYVDDVHGWNFMGSKKGSFQQDNYDLVRLLRQSTKGSAEAEQLQASVNDNRRRVQQELQETKITIEALEAIVEGIGNPNPSLADFKNYHYSNYVQEQQLLLIVAALKYNFDLPAYREHLQSIVSKATDELKYSLNISYNPRNGKEFSNPFNGNGDVQGPWAVHGSHVAGIIAGRAVGVAKNNVQLMILRTVPTGDFLDADMARAIRYAADNGAKVINISAGKSGSTDPGQLEAAVRYAMDKDVLIIHASGNSGELLEQGYYPRAAYNDGKKAKAWVEVGASGPENDSTLILKASNYGKSVVDVFAPGVKIRSCSPGNGYSKQSGTSMAAPVVSGIAAVLRSYFPELNAEKVCEAILDSVQKINYKIQIPNGIMVPFTETCAAGGVANLYLAVQLAQKLITHKR